YAEHGFPLGEVVSAYWRDSFDVLKADAPTAKTFLVNGRLPKTGEVFRNPELAATYRLIATQGRDGFYKGTNAEKMIATFKAHGGILGGADLAEYSAEWVEPISTNYRGWTVSELPPNGQGIAALEMLNIMERFPVAEMGHNTAKSLHVMIEAK